MSDFSATTKDITVVPGVSVNIEVSGDEDRAEKTMMELKDHLGRIAEAYDREEPPTELSGRRPRNAPILTVNWEAVFEDD